MSRHYAIKCTNCAAPLDILGGGRVQTITCRYCHSVLDMNDHYKVLSQFNTVKRPKLPFSIGMHGMIKGVAWTIIGLVQYKTDDPSDAPWVELCLFSPTHGYAWLVKEGKHYYFTKRIRDFDLFTWIDKKPKSLFYRKGHYLQKEPLYFSFIDYVEGELTWIAKKNDRFMVWDYSGVHFQALSIEENSGELEVYHSQRLKNETLFPAFGVPFQTEPKPPKAKKESPTEQTYPKTNNVGNTPQKSYSKLFIALFALLIITVFASFFYKKTILKTTFKTDFHTQITIPDNAFLTTIALEGYKGHNEHLKLYLYQDKTVLFSMNEHQAIFPDKTVKPSWTPTSLSATAYIKLNRGTYRLVVQKSNPKTAVTLIVKQHVIRLSYLLSLIGIFLLLGLYYYVGSDTIWKIAIFAAFIAAVIIFGAEMLIPILLIGVLVILSKFMKKSSYNSSDDWEDDGDD